MGTAASAAVSMSGMRLGLWTLNLHASLENVASNAEDSVQFEGSAFRPARIFISDMVCEGKWSSI